MPNGKIDNKIINEDRKMLVHNFLRETISVLNKADKAGRQTKHQLN